jgi:N-acetylglucosaminyldiphosphoundecaprenol N-acetyl-beta-D-mannosaminyltransferase
MVLSPVNPQGNRKKEGGPGIKQQIPVTSILGIPVHDVSAEHMRQIFIEMALNGKSHQIVPLNTECLMSARQHEEFHRAIDNAALVIPDGIGVVWASRILGQSLTERVTGVDMVWMLARIARDNGFSIFLLGAASGVAEKAASILQTANPGLKIAGTYAGSPHPTEENDICTMIEKANPQILFVAYGAPKQDVWIARTQARLKVPIMMGVGGTFDFITGASKRAPLWMQQSGLEWFYRLIKEPRRWRRMLSLPKFVGVVLRKRVSQTFMKS